MNTVKIYTPPRFIAKTDDLPGNVDIGGGIIHQYGRQGSMPRNSIYPSTIGTFRCATGWSKNKFVTVTNNSQQAIADEFW